MYRRVEWGGRFFSSFVLTRFFIRNKKNRFSCTRHRNRPREGEWVVRGTDKDRYWAGETRWLYTARNRIPHQTRIIILYYYSVMTIISVYFSFFQKRTSYYILYYICRYTYDDRNIIISSRIHDCLWYHP